MLELIQMIGIYFYLSKTMIHNNNTSNCQSIRYNCSKQQGKIPIKINIKMNINT